MYRHVSHNSKTPKEIPSNYLMDTNSLASPKSKMEKDNSSDVPSKGIASIADNQDIWHATVGSRRRPKYHMWPKDN